MSTTSEAVRVAVWGLGPWGHHHLERLVVTPGCRVVCVGDAEPSKLASLIGGPWETVTDPSQLVQNRNLDAVVVAVPASEQFAVALRLFGSARVLVLEPPRGVSLAEAEYFFAAADRARQLLRLACRERWEAEFLSIRSLLRSQRLGPVDTIRHITWQYAKPPAFVKPPSAVTCEVESNLATEAGAAATVAASAPSVLWDFLYPRVDQLLDVIGEIPSHLRAFPLTRVAPPGDDSSGPRGNHPDAAAAPILAPLIGLSVWLRFPSGTTAVIEHHRHARAPLHTGWMLEGRDASFARNTLYEETPEGEIVDIPLPEPDPAAADFHRALIQSLVDQHFEMAPSATSLATYRVMLEIERQVEMNP